MSLEFCVKPIATVASSRTEARDDNWDTESSLIRLDFSVLGESAASGLNEFSHIEVIYVFDRVDHSRVVSDARHPRGNTDWPKVGILAQRGKNRPNRIGATVCELVSVVGDTITVKGLDAIDGTPVIDIKPVMTGFLPRGPVKEPAWVAELMADYW